MAELVGDNGNSEATGDNGNIINTGDSGNSINNGNSGSETTGKGAVVTATPPTTKEYAINVEGGITKEYKVQSVFNKNSFLENEDM